MKKRLLSILLCLIMIVGLIPTVAFAADTAYDLWVSGVQVTSANKDNILGDTGTPTATFDPAKGELTLDGYDGGSIVATGDLSIVLADGTENAVSVPVDVEGCGIRTVGNCTLSGSGDLNIEVLHPAFDGIWADDGDLTVDMTGDLTVNAGDDGLYADNDLTISGSGNITVTAGDDGFYAYFDSVTVSGSGNITITADCDGIDSYVKGNVIFSGSRNIIFTAGHYGISVGGVEIKDTCKVSVDAGAGDYAVRLWNSGSKLLLNGTGAPISLKSGTGKAAVWNSADSNSPVGGSNIANYAVTGAPDTDSVVYTLHIPITEVTVLNFESPIAGKTTGELSNLKLPEGVHYSFDPSLLLILNMFNYSNWFSNTWLSKDKTFTAGNEYQEGVWLIADEGYYFAEDCTFKAIGADNVEKPLDEKGTIVDKDDSTFAYIWTAPETCDAPIPQTVKVVIYRNGNTETPYKTIDIGPVNYDETIDLTALFIGDCYDVSNDFAFEGWFNDGAWNQYKAGNNPAALDSITVKGWTNIIGMVTDYVPVKVYATYDGVQNRDNDELIYDGTALVGTDLAGYLADNVSVNVPYGYKWDGEFMNYDSYGHGYAEGTTVNGWTNVYVNFERQEYTVVAVIDDNGVENVKQYPQTGLFGEGVDYGVVMDWAEEYANEKYPDAANIDIQIVKPGSNPTNIPQTFGVETTNWNAQNKFWVRVKITTSYEVNYYVDGELKKTDEVKINGLRRYAQAG